MVKIEEINNEEISLTLHQWQIDELEAILLEEETNPQPCVDAFVFLKELREKHLD